MALLAVLGVIIAVSAAAAVVAYSAHRVPLLVALSMLALAQTSLLLGPPHLALAAVSALASGAAGLLGLLAWREHRRASAELAENVRLSRLLRDRADQVAILSHEIRTPLTLIKAGAELLAEQAPGPLTAKQSQFVDTIRANTDHIISLAEDLLLQARIEAGVFHVQLSLVDIRAVLRSAVRELRTIYSQDLLLDTPGAGRRIYVDKQLIRQAVINLVNNAARHSDPSTTIVVRAVSYGDAVLVSVTDGGSGMSDEERRGMFTRFSSSSSPRDGAGLGLLITKKIVELHGGSIHVDTMTRRGTTVLFSIPIQTPDEISE